MNREEATARLTLRFEKDDEKTYLASQYYKLPLQVLPPHYQDDDGTAFVYLLNPSGGIMQGDRLLTEITVCKNASVVATTPAPTKYYKMEDDNAVLCNEFAVGENAVLEYIPEHNVPFNDTDVYQSNTFHLNASSTLIAMDAVTSGRKAKGECFGYNRFCSRISLYVDDSLILRDCMDVRPKEENLKAIGVLEGNEIIAGMYLYQHGKADEINRYISENMKRSGDIKVGITSPNEDLVIVRILSSSILDYKETIAELWKCCRAVMLKKKAVRLRKY